HAEARLAEASLAVFEAEATRRLYPTVSERSLTVPYGLDLTPIEAVRAGFDRERTRRELAIDAEADLAVCVGTVEPRKAQVQLARAFDLVAARHPRAQLAFVGSDEGPTRRPSRPASPPAATAGGCGWCRGPRRSSAGSALPTNSSAPPTSSRCRSRSWRQWPGRGPCSPPAS